ncbi:UPF0598 protein C8orf82 homolog isoform X4 [Hemicordylus capensis]|uniref:UPF0598 protein C8orf82 homolog isoform X4 n=1 Tax=Hemicordylus capensis TaxID=884348 RepID=UPI0023035517|nr:UPF0598 protein C8orf82 homolog isoform X4 [Hemicordylus capensis]
MYVFATFQQKSSQSSLHTEIRTMRCFLSPKKLFLDDAKVKNFITCFKDKQFLAFFFKQLKLNQSGRYQDSFPYLSPCGREHNYLRCDDRPIVFTHLLQGAAGEEVLSYCGGAERLVVPFQPEKLVMLPENGRVYHPGPAKAGGVGLVKSALAFELSPCFEYELGPTHPPTHFCWRDKRHTLTNELLQCIQDKDEGA